MAATFAIASAPPPAVASEQSCLIDLAAGCEPGERRSPRDELKSHVKAAHMARPPLDEDQFGRLEGRWTC